MDNDLYASFWLDGDDINSLTGIEHLMKLASFRRAISNFVTIVTGKNIPVTYREKGTSYTDGNKVVISSDISRETFDSVVGLALHESAHILLSNFSHFKDIDKYINDWQRKMAEKKNVSSAELVDFAHVMLNIVEDRYIDNFIYTHAPGYRGYYQSLYDRYWNSPEMDKGLESSEYRD
jgi:hypothetical protein